MEHWCWRGSMSWGLHQELWCALSALLHRSCGCKTPQRGCGEGQAWDFFWCLTLFLFFLKTSSAHRKSLEVLQAGTFAFHNPACGHSAVASALEQQLLLFPLYVTWMLSLLKSGNVGHKYDNIGQAGISAIMHIFTINVFEKS